MFVKGPSARLRRSLMRLGLISAARKKSKRWGGNLVRDGHDV